jgi:hypothetical protein
MTTQPINTDTASPSAEEFWLFAFIGSTLGTLLGTITLMILVALFDPLWSVGAELLAGALSGLGAGAIQGAFLRRSAQPKLLWLGLSCGGWLIAIILSSSITRFWPGADARREIGIAAVGGAVIGTCQWAILRRYRRRVVWWVPLNAAIWAGLTLLYLILFGPWIGLASW